MSVVGRSLQVQLRIARPIQSEEPAVAIKTVFYSFHYERDVNRVQLVRNINALEGQPLLNAQEWETVQRRGQQAVVNWIDEQMRYKRAVVVLIGQETASRSWVIYEIEKAWKEKRVPTRSTRRPASAVSQCSTRRSRTGAETSIRRRRT
jgi:hypothetical protein